MEDIVDRIKELKDTEGLSNTEFANKINVGPAVISHIMSGRNKPSLQVIASIKQAFTNVNTDYLLSGDGQLYGGFTDVKESEGSDPTPAFDTNVMQREIQVLPPPEGPPVHSIEEEEKQEEAPATKGKAQDLQKENTPPSRPEKQEAKSEEIERIVIFYKDGTFKSYRP